MNSIHTKYTEISHQSNYSDIYSRRETVAIGSVERAPDGVGAVVKLKSDLEDFSHFVCSINGGEFLPVENGKVTLRFAEDHSTEIQLTELQVRAVSKDGTQTQPYRLETRYYSEELYKDRGRLREGGLILQQTDMTFLDRKYDSWENRPLTDEEVEYAKERWGHIVSEEQSDFENARALAMAIQIPVDPYRGTPSDIMNDLSPFDQFERTAAGKDRVYCENMAAIFSTACAAFGITCRRIRMGNTVSPATKDNGYYKIMIAEGHSTTEVFCRQLNRWAWIDSSNYSMGAYLCGRGPINLAEMLQFLNDPAWADALEIDYFNVAENRLDRDKVLENSRRTLFKYFRRPAQIRYLRPE